MLESKISVLLDDERKLEVGCDKIWRKVHTVSIRMSSRSESRPKGLVSRDHVL